MDEIRTLIDSIEPIDEKTQKAMREKVDALAKPLGSLGRLEELCVQIAAITRSLEPVIDHKWISIFSADHGIAPLGVTNAPQDITAFQTRNFIKGGAGINALSSACGISLQVTNMGMVKDCDPTGIRQNSLGRGTGNIAEGPAMSRDQAHRSLMAGKLAIEEIEQLDILGTGEMGLGNTSPSTAICSVLLGLDVDSITGIGSGITQEAREKKVSLIRQAIAINRPDPTDPIDVLAKVGGFEIGAMAGAMLAAAARRVPVVIDGFISSAAALVALRLAPRLKDYLILSHQSAEKGHDLISRGLGLRPLFDLDLRLGEGTGAALAISLCEKALAIPRSMITLQALGSIR